MGYGMGAVVGTTGGMIWEAYTIFVRGLNKEELELYTDMKARRDAEDEAKRTAESSDSEESESESESESDTDSDSGSDSD